ncbi:hypothetical protein [Leptolyngbya sp. 'hensonii']|nr:hypothetical protein [Leptolyngbya sp. 'hensonii']
MRIFPPPLRQQARAALLSPHAVEPSPTPLTPPTGKKPKALQQSFFPYN